MVAQALLPAVPRLVSAFGVGFTHALHRPNSDPKEHKPNEMFYFHTYFETKWHWAKAPVPQSSRATTKYQSRVHIRDRDSASGMCILETEWETLATLTYSVPF